MSKLYRFILTKPVIKDDKLHTSLNVVLNSESVKTIPIEFKASEMYSQHDTVNLCIDKSIILVYKIYQNVIFLWDIDLGYRVYIAIPPPYNLICSITPGGDYFILKLVKDKYDFPEDGKYFLFGIKKREIIPLDVPKELIPDSIYQDKCYYIENVRNRYSNIYNIHIYSLIDNKFLDKLSYIERYDPVHKYYLDSANTIRNIQTNDAMLNFTNFKEKLAVFSKYFRLGDTDLEDGYILISTRDNNIFSIKYEDLLSLDQENLDFKDIMEKGIVKYIPERFGSLKSMNENSSKLYQYVVSYRDDIDSYPTKIIRLLSSIRTLSLSMNRQHMNIFNPLTIGNIIQEMLKNEKILHNQALIYFLVDYTMDKVKLDETQFRDEIVRLLK